MRYRMLAAVAVLVLATGCATRPVISLTAPFDPVATAAQLKDGPNTIKGSALFRQMGGGVVTCAGFPVALLPATDYAKERFTAIYGSSQGGLNSVNRPMAPVFKPDYPEYQKLVRETQCDAQGFFKFDRVMDGEYYVYTGIGWQVGYTAQGGLISTLVRVTGGETKEIVLAR